MERIKRTLYQPLALMAVAMLGLASTNADAGTTAYVVDDNTEDLYRLDLVTLETTLVGQIGVDFVYDIAALTDGTIAGQNDAVPGYFLIDSADASLLGSGPNNSGGDFIGDLDGLGGRLYSYRNDQLREIDPLTGARTTIATLAIPTNERTIAMVSETEAFILGFGNVGLRELYRVNFGTGSVEIISSVTDASLNFRSLDYADGVLYAMSSNGSLSIVDQANGSVTLVGQIGISNVSAFTIVPMPGTLAALGFAGFVFVKRRR